VQRAHADCRLALAAEELGPRQFLIHVVGDLPEDEARRYFCGGGDWPGLIKQSAAVPRGGLEAWPKVHAACGGNIGLLHRCVAAAKLLGGWEEGELQLRDPRLSHRASGVQPFAQPCGAPCARATLSCSTSRPAFCRPRARARCADRCLVCVLA
jgi:hypothetical protein